MPKDSPFLSVKVALIALKKCTIELMSYISTPFADFLSNVYSQNGEDGVLGEICNRLGLLDIQMSPGWCVEFGAWDGKHLSNTFLLVETHQWNAVYIEGDPKRFQELVATSHRYPTIIPICSFITPDEHSPNNLAKILSGTPIPNDFDILSIDIDSFDLDIWEQFRKYKPKIVVIEINSSIWPGLFWRHSYLPVAHCYLNGNSFSSTVHVANLLGYVLVCHTGNCIFVREDLIDKIGLPERYLKDSTLLFRPDWLQPSTPSDGIMRMSEISARRSLISSIKTFLIALGLRKLLNKKLDGEMGPP